MLGLSGTVHIHNNSKSVAVQGQTPRWEFGHIEYLLVTVARDGRYSG